MAEIERIETNKVIQFLGTRGNLVGVGTGFVGFLASIDVLHRPIFVLPVAAAMYGGGYLLGRDYRKKVTLDTGNHQDKVEAANIERSLHQLEQQLLPYRSRLPGDVTTRIDSLIAGLREILPRWGRLHSFAEQRYTVNQIVTDYLPTILSNYLNLPSSLYHNSAKRQFHAEIITQLDILLDTVAKIRESLFDDMEQNLKVQTKFLQDKFTTGENKLLHLP